ncbi:MAG: CRISPR-associated protein Cas4 [Candidatus Marinimicrobia bacterium]|nr:CRISPR-associated protein Cas4 [Candidatus Neomarinimicrobiota bacterium]
MITPSEVMEYLYCPRFTYFLNVMRIEQYEDKRFKVQKGRRVHEDRMKHNKDYLRKKIATIKKEMDIYLADPELGIRGIVDEILWLNDGTLAPVDYKYTQFKDTVFRTHKYQLVLYGMLIEKMYNMDVKRGYIVYIRGGSKTKEVAITASLKEKALCVVKEIMQIIMSEKLPRKTKHQIRCYDCTYKNICV